MADQQDVHEKEVAADAISADDADEKTAARDAEQRMAEALGVGSEPAQPEHADTAEEVFAQLDAASGPDEEAPAVDEVALARAALAARDEDENEAEEAARLAEKAKKKAPAKKKAAAEDEGGEELAEDEEPEAGSLAAEAQIRVLDDGIKRRWYALHSHSGQESNVKKNLMILSQNEELLDKIANVLVPMEEVAEIKSGQKKVSKRKFFPGYVLVQLPEHPEQDADLWHAIKNTPGVTGFIGSRTEPVPLEDAEVNAILEEMRGERERPKPKVKFEQGERVKIIDGPFANFLGNIDEINLDRGKLKVMVEIFERLTSVEVEFWQVEKI